MSTREPVEWPEAGRPLGHAKKLKEQNEALMEKIRQEKEAADKAAASAATATTSSSTKQSFK